MGIYLNPGNEGFKIIRNSTYVDKTGMIDYINSTIDTSSRMTCFSRPRRFGKSFAAKMLCAYYDKSCDSHGLFDDLEIAGKPSYAEHLNKYDVIYLDITYSIICAKSKGKNILQDMQESVIEELRAAFPDCVKEGEKYLANALVGVSGKTGGKFIVIIDEWDALFREAKDDAALQREYVELLRGLFKGGVSTDLTIAAAYMTGILPIKKYGTQSAMTDFIEFTMVNPDELARYVGFTQDEVKRLCEDSQMDFEEMRVWYDGYSTANMQHIYNPNSVMKALQRKSVRNYWTMSETFESLKSYISMNFDGLKDSVIQMMGGQQTEIDIITFQNDMTSFHSRDDVLTLLVHLGYLAYDSLNQEAYIPNREVAEVFKSSVKGGEWKPVEAAIKQAQKLLDATIQGDSDTVAASLELAHEACSSVLTYNDENSLACSIYIAYYTAKNYYTIIRELPTGRGFADYVFIPRTNTDKPALIVELKYNRDADSAIKQIHEKRYDGALKDYTGNMLLVGINYDKETKKHSCMIEEA